MSLTLRQCPHLVLTCNLITCDQLEVDASTTTINMRLDPAFQMQCISMCVCVFFFFLTDSPGYPCHCGCVSTDRRPPAASNEDTAHTQKDWRSHICLPQSETWNTEKVSACVCVMRQRRTERRKAEQAQLLIVPSKHNDWGQATFIAGVVFPKCPCVLSVWPCS